MFHFVSIRSINPNHRNFRKFFLLKTVVHATSLPFYASLNQYALIHIKNAHMKTFSTLVIILCFSIPFYAQNLNISGSVTDSLDVPLPQATIMLLEMDSTLVDYTTSDDDGKFTLKRIPKGDYLFKATYIGYVPFMRPLPKGETEINLGQIKMNEIAAELMEVVIKEARAPISFRGDTLEYDARTFKVPEGSTVEDLLRRLPGVQVARDGSIQADGQDVTKVKVEGKDFFGGDPTTVTKNLPAAGVSKVQVYDRKTEEEKLTGIKSNTDEKEMNIELKDGFKKGGFGKVVAGYGSEARAELKGNYNRFNDKNQLGLVAVGNNTGRNGLGWDDYQDFMGSQAFNWNARGLDYGFGSAGGVRFISFGNSGGNELENSIQNAFFSRNNNGGYPENINGGLSFNHDNKPNKIGAQYFFTLTGNERNSQTTSTSFFNDFTSKNDRTSLFDDQVAGHRGEFSYEVEIDSFHTVMVMADLAAVNRDNVNSKTELILRDENELTTSSLIDNTEDFQGGLINSTILLRKSFRSKKGRFFGANFSYLYTDVQTTNLIDTDISFFENNEVDSASVFLQTNNSDAFKNAIKFNTMFNEPLSKRFFISVFYNFNSRKQEGDAIVRDEIGGEIFDNALLSRSYTNDVSDQRVGSTLTYSFKGLNISTGYAFQSFDLKGDLRGSISSLDAQIDQTFDTWIPYLSIQKNWGRRGRVSFSAVRNIQAPTIEQMIPIIDNRNPLFVTEGNPNLLPQSGYNFRANVSRSSPLSGFRIYANFNITLQENSIIQSQEVDENLVTFSKPINYDGGRRLSSYVGLGYPIIKNKIRSSLNFFISQNQSFAFVNNLLNETTTNNTRPNFSLDITPNEKIGLYLNASLGVTDVKYDISTSQNQKINNNEIGADFNVKIADGLFFNSSYDHTFYSSDRFGQDTDVPIINLSIYKQFLKNKKGELRFSVYDLLDENVQFRQFGGGNTVTQSITNSLSRYIMFSFTYNIRGLKGNVQKNRYW